MNFSALGDLRVKLQGARKIPIRAAKVLVGVEPLRRVLGAPAGHYSLEQARSDLGALADVEEVGPIEPSEEIHIPPASIAIGSEIQNKGKPIRLIANARSVFLVPNGKYRNAAGHFEIAVLDRADRLVTEISPDAMGPELHRIYGQFSLRQERKINGRVVVLTTPGARTNYFHWCLELLPKIHLLQTRGLFHPERDAFLVNHDGYPYQIKTMELLGLPAKNVIRSFPGIKISAEQLIVPSHSENYEAVPKWAIQFLRDRFIKYASPERASKLFLDRGESPRRRMVNSYEVRRFLEQRGYNSVNPATLSLGQQVGLLRNAKKIISSHGAALTNLSYATPDTHVLEIFSPFYAPDYFRVVAQQVGLGYCCVCGIPADEKRKVTDLQRISHEYKVPLDRLVHALEAFERL